MCVAELDAVLQAEGLPLTGAADGLGRKSDCGWPHRREHSLTDALETSYNVLRIKYLQMVGHAFEDAAAWQDAEAALYALR